MTTEHNSPKQPQQPFETASLAESTLSPETAEAIAALETELSLLWRRARVVNMNLTRSVHPELEPAAYGLLSVLSTQGAMRLTDLAKAIGVGKPSVSRQIKFLEEIGLVVKESDPLDGRAQLIGLSQHGRETMASTNAGRRNRFHHILAHWDDQELNTLASLLGKLNQDSAAS